MVNGACETMWRQPLGHGLGGCEGTIQALGRRFHDTVKTNGSWHGGALLSGDMDFDAGFGEGFSAGSQKTPLAESMMDCPFACRPNQPVMSRS
jgi:hypothetical protein